jgi:hypothetical protein
MPDGKSEVSDVEGLSERNPDGIDLAETDPYEI